MQNLVAVSHSVCAYEGSLKNLGDATAGPTHCEEGRGDSLETHASPVLPCQMIVLGQTMRA